MANDMSTDSPSGEHRFPQPDPQGQAALLLIESLIHSLLDNGALTKSQALEAIESAKQVKEERVEQEQEPARIARTSLALLINLQHSIEAHSGRYHSETKFGAQSER